MTGAVSGLGLTGFAVGLPVVGIGFFGGLVIALLLLARFTPGSGADLLDWHPNERADERQRVDHEDVERMLEAMNRRRRAAGRPELSVDEIQRGHLDEGD